MKTILLFVTLTFLGGLYCISAPPAAAPAPAAPGVLPPSNAGVPPPSPGVLPPSNAGTPGAPPQPVPPPQNGINTNGVYGNMPQNTNGWGAGTNNWQTNNWQSGDATTNTAP